VFKGRAGIEKIRSIANYQFGRGAGRALFPNGVRLEYSRATGRIRRVYLDGKVLATLRARDGLFSLTVDGAKRLKARLKPPKLRVVVERAAEEAVGSGRNVFAKHVVKADEEIRPSDEVTVTNLGDEVLAVGKAVLTGVEMTRFKRGVAVKVRRGISEGVNEKVNRAAGLA